MMQEYHKGLLQLGIYNSGHNNNNIMLASLDHYPEAILGIIMYDTQIERPILWHQ